MSNLNLFGRHPWKVLIMLGPKPNREGEWESLPGTEFYRGKRYNWVRSFWVGPFPKVEEYCINIITD